MDAILREAKHAARLLLRSPGFTIGAVATLSVGIAANTAIFSVVNTVLWKPFAYSDPQRIVMFQNLFPAGRSGSASPTEFNWWRQQNRAFDDVSGYDFGIANLTGETSPEQIPIMHVSADFFRLCGGKAIFGRTFQAGDDLPGAPRVAVLAYSFWQRRFAGDPAVVGRRLTLSGERYEVIGVAGRRLENAPIAERSTLSGDIEIDQPPDVYLALAIDPFSSSHGHSFNVAGRLKDGVSPAAAEAQLRGSYQEFARRWPGVDMPGRTFGLQILQDAVVGGVRNSLLLLWGAVGLVLLMACANAANLLLTRAAGRRREIAIRAAVGATRRHLVRQLLTESVMLSLSAGALGLAAGYAGIRAVLTWIPSNLPRIGVGGAQVGFDWRVAGFITGLSLLTGIVFGLAPAWQASRADLAEALKAGGATSGSGLRLVQTRAILVAAETGLAVVLLTGAALLVRSFLELREVNPGFDPHHVVITRMLLAGPQFAKPEMASQVISDGLRRLRSLPGVEAAAATCCVPLEDRLHGAFQISGRAPGPSAGGLTGYTMVSAGYFETFRIPLMRGRTFREEDEHGPPVVIINQTMARRFWPDSDPLKDQIAMGRGPRRQIVGVAGDVRDESLNREPRPYLYIPSGDGGSMLQSDPLAWVVRTQAPPQEIRAALEKELREASGGLPVAPLRSMDEAVSRSLSKESFNTLISMIFGGAAVLLAAIGIYGLMAYSVTQRVREIGIRLALGAEPGDIRRLVVGQGLRPALAGIAGGLAAALAASRLLAGLLFGVKTWDPIVFLMVPIILGVIALLAAWAPAVRASRVAPLRALRHD